MRNMAVAVPKVVRVMRTCCTTGVSSAPQTVCRIASVLLARAQISFASGTTTFWWPCGVLVFSVLRVCGRGEVCMHPTRRGKYANVSLDMIGVAKTAPMHEDHA